MPGAAGAQRRGHADAGALRARLTAVRFTQLAAEELAQLRRGADVRMMVPWARAAGDAAP